MVLNELVERIATKQVVTTNELVAHVSDIIGSMQENKTENPECRIRNKSSINNILLIRGFKNKLLSCIFFI